MSLGAIIDVPRVRRVLRRWGWLLLLVVLVVGSSAYYAAGRTPLRAEATATLLIGPPEGDLVDYQSILSFERVATTYTNMVLLEPVLRRAIDLGTLPLTPDEIRPLMDVRNPTSTQFITVRARHADGGLAARIANSVAEAFSLEVLDAPDGQARRIQFIDPAAASTSAPVPPGPAVSAVLSASLAFLLAAGGVLVVEAGSRAVTTSTDAEQAIGWPVIGRLGRLPRGSRRAFMQLVASSEDGAGNWFRLLRTHFLNHLEPGQNVFVLASPHADGGTTTTILGLATVLGMAGYRVCVVDADSRRPSMHMVFATPAAPGLTDLLAEAAPPWAEVVCETPVNNVSLLAAGTGGFDGLSARRFASAVQPLSEAFDVVLVDAAPLQVGAEALAVCAGGGKTLLVVREGRTRLDALRRTVDDLARSDARVVGVVYTDSVEV